MIELKENECLEDLECNGLEIIQDKNGYRFTSDAVLLANFINALPASRVVDLGTGSGIISILIASKTKAKLVVGVEIQQRLAEMAARSVAHNNLTEKINIINKPMQNIHKEIGNDFDIVVTNPPYEKAQTKANPTETEICRQEYLVSLSEVIQTASKLLKFGGMFYIINKARRLADMIYFMRSNDVEPKKITMIQPKANKDVDTVIVEAKKGGKPSLVVPKPFIVYNDDGSFTEQARRIYGK